MWMWIEGHSCCVQICWHMLAHKWGFPYSRYPTPPCKSVLVTGGMASTKSGDTTRTDSQAVPQPTISVRKHESVHKNLQKYSCIENRRSLSKILVLHRSYIYHVALWNNLRNLRHSPWSVSNEVATVPEQPYRHIGQHIQPGTNRSKKQAPFSDNGFSK